MFVVFLFVWLMEDYLMHRSGVDLICVHNPCLIEWLRFSWGKSSRPPEPASRIMRCVVLALSGYSFWFLKRTIYSVFKGSETDQ